MNFSKIMEIANNFILVGKENEILNMSDSQNVLMGLASILLSIAIAVLLIVGMIMGVKYMISGADERANLKEKLVWYVVSAVLIFGVTGIYNLIVSVVTSILS